MTMKCTYSMKTKGVFRFCNKKYAVILTQNVQTNWQTSHPLFRGIYDTYLNFPITIAMDKDKRNESTMLIILSKKH